MVLRELKISTLVDSIPDLSKDLFQLNLQFFNHTFLKYGLHYKLSSFHQKIYYEKVPGFTLDVRIKFCPVNDIFQFCCLQKQLGNVPSDHNIEQTSRVVY